MRIIPVKKSPWNIKKIHNLENIIFVSWLEGGLISIFNFKSGQLLMEFGDYH